MNISVAKATMNTLYPYQQAINEEERVLKYLNTYSEYEYVQFCNLNLKTFVTCRASSSSLTFYFNIC